MTSAAKAKGSGFERDALNHGRDRGQRIERLRATGTHDEGDLVLLGGPGLHPELIIPAVLHKRRMKGITEAYLTVQFDRYLDLNEHLNVQVATILEAKARARMALAEWMEEAIVEAGNWARNRNYPAP